MAVTTNPVTEASPLDVVKSTAEQMAPLENGDRLTRPEFEQRYEAMPGLKKAELIEGVVYVPSPVNFDRHGGPHFDLISWLGQYRMATPGVRGGDNSSLRLDLDNEPQPDVFLMVLPGHGGQAQIDSDGYISGVPELVVEVASSSVSYDLHDKLDVYRRHGAREYLVWRVLDQAVDWFALRDGRYELLSRDEASITRSEVFPGLWLDVEDLLPGDLAAVFQVLQQGLASPEHAEFVDRLRQAAASH
jgi:Uma2 family endonuclease